MNNIRQSATGQIAQNLEEVAAMGVYEAINMIQVLDRFGRIPQVGYPKLQADLPHLRVTLDTDSLAAVQSEDALARDWLVAIGKGINVGEPKPCIDLLLTPARSSLGAEWFAKLSVATYDTNTMLGPLKRLHDLSLKTNWEQMRQPEEPTALIIDVDVHRALGRHLFVTCNQSQLNLGFIPRAERNDFVLSPTEARRFSQSA